MKKLILGALAVAALSLPSVANAQLIKDNNDAEAAVGGTIGGATGGVAGAIVGGLIFGPIGAAIGGFTGATIGAAGGVDAASVDYVRLNPTEPVVIEGTVEVGYVVPEEIVVHTIEGDATHGYFYTNDRVYFVDLTNREIVYSPGTVVAVEAN